MRTGSVAAAFAAGAMCAMALAGCAPAEASPRTLTVYAAASLTEVFADLEAEFESTHPGIDVVMMHGGSADLAAAISAGAPADVFAAAGEQQLDAVAAEHASAPRLFATNTLIMVVEQGNPLGLAGLADLTREDVTSVVCAAQVPCGDATTRLAARSGVPLAPASEERSVTDVLGKVASGQADAGIVYTTDATRAQGVEAVALAGADQVRSRYPIAVLSTGTAPALAQEFVDLVVGRTGEATLAAHGFGAP